MSSEGIIRARRVESTITKQHKFNAGSCKFDTKAKQSEKSLKFNKTNLQYKNCRLNRKKWVK